MLEIFFVKKIWVEIFFGSKKIGVEIFCGEKNWVVNFFGLKKFGSTKFWVNCFLHESSSWVKIGLHIKNQLPGGSGSGLKVCRGWWVGGLEYP